MKLLITLFFIAVCSWTTGQMPNDLKFDRNFVEAENQWVVVPNKTEATNKFKYGFLYFDESGGGYSLQEINDFTVADGKFIKTPVTQKQLNIVRLGNSALKFSFLSQQRIAELNLETTPAFLKNYIILKDESAKKLMRASAINGLNRPDLALPILKSLHAGNFNTKQLYFELAFAYNALKNFNEAEKIIDEAETKGYLDELLIKEKIYAYSHSNKLEEANKFLRSKISVFKSSLYKEESIANMVVNYYRSKNFSKTKEWLDIYDNEFPGGGKYKTNIEKLKSDFEKEAVK